MSGMEEQGHLADLVEQLEREAMELDGGGDASGVHLLFRTVHNLKSLSAYVGLAELAGSFHTLEDGLDRIRRGKEAWSPEWSDQVFRSIDLARATLGGENPTPAAHPAEKPPPVKHTWGLPLGEAESARVADALLSGQGVYRIEKLFKSGLSLEDFQGLPVMEDVAEQGTLLAIHPAWEAYRNGPAEQVVKFLFASPRTRAELEQVFFDPLIELQAPQPAPAAAPIRILIIEDDASTSALLRHLLKKHGPCMVAGTARDGFAAFLKAWEQSQPYQILFLDLHLPDLSGLSILSALRRFESDRRVPHNRRCLVVVSTASDDLEDIKAALVLEADGYLVKPLSPEAIEEKISLLKETWLAEN